MFLCCKYLKIDSVTIPKHTFIAVPEAIINAGGKPIFVDETWSGAYQLKPYPIWDSACRLTNNMFTGGYWCISFQYRKHIPIGKGGMILTNDSIAAEWFRRARFHGRLGNKPIELDPPTIIGWNMYMTPEQASRGIILMNELPSKNEDLKFEYPDLSNFECYKCH